MPTHRLKVALRHFAGSRIRGLLVGVAFVSLALGCAEPLLVVPPVIVAARCESLDTVALLRASHCPVLLASAHRGDRSAGPENSVTGVVGASKHGIRLVELDVRRSADGAFFLFHDKHFSDRTICSAQRGQWGRLAESLTSAELRQLYLPPDCTEPVATVAQLFAALRVVDVAVQLDLKGESLRGLPELMAAAAREGVEQKMIIQLEEPELMKAIRDVYPTVPILARCFDRSQVDQALPFRPEIIQIDSSLVDKDVIAKIHDAGVRVLVKSVGATDEPVRWSNLASQGVEIILTDRADEMMAMLPALRPTPETVAMFHLPTSSELLR